MSIMANKFGDPVYQYAFSGRTIGKMLRKRRGGGLPSSQHNGLRRHAQLKPAGPNRFPRGHKYMYGDGTPCPL